MTYSSCDGGFVPEKTAAFLDHLAQLHRAYPAPDYDTRSRGLAERKAVDTKRDVEDRLVSALVKVASRSGDIECATMSPRERRDDDDDADRIAREHGFSPDRLIAMRALARSRGVGLDVVLRAALRGDLRDIVTMPPRNAEKAP